MDVFQVSRASPATRRLPTNTIFSSSVVRIALSAALGISAGMATMATADAAVFWTDEDPMVMREIVLPPPQPQQRQKRLKTLGAKLEKQVKDHAKPVGPLVINISIERQTMRVFDANGLFAETPVSTGMRGHATPMGVFSIIQKNKWHRSNIYSGAPMPYMQRITWSGIALHAGALPGYPASHGCIRMPMAFATRIWGWTRMGARVIITPGEITPAQFAHPLLVAQKPAPVPVAATSPDAVTTSKSDNSGLQPTASHDRARTQTADASNAMVAPAKTAVMSDATPTETPGAAPASDESDKTGTAKTEAATVDATKVKEIEADTRPISADARKDESRPVDAAVKPETPVADAAPKRTGQIAVLVSGKDGKLYVRQNFAPLFETAIAIKPSDQPLGTHIFTARTDKDDARSLHWTAVSLPAVPHRADVEDNASRRRKSTGAVEVKTRPLPNSASEALDRLTIPADAMAQIAEALANGGSIVVSDQGIAAGGETGQGTEFVVPLR